MFGIRKMSGEPVPIDELLAFEESMQASYIRQCDLVNAATMENYALMQLERQRQALEMQAFKKRNRIGFC